MGQKILVIRFSSIGDIVLTTPVVRALKQQIPEVEMHYLTKKTNYSLLQNNKYIDKIHLLEDADLFHKLRKEKFDYIVDLHKNLRSFKIKLALGVKSKSFQKLNLKKLLLVKFKINNMPNVHIVDRYLETASKLGVKNDNKGLDYFLQEEDYISSDALPLDFQGGYIAIVVGSKHYTKQMPLELLIRICKGIDKPIILLGDKTDFAKATQIEKEVGVKVFNGCGAYNINQSSAVIKNSLGVITADTGLMHIASALDKNIICLWGNTVMDFGMYPYRSENSQAETHNFEVKNLSCRPCSKLGYKQCPKKHFKCMNAQNVDEIIRIANNWE
jgi:ADP-heptose:LPS heptosyltransferase